MPKTVRVLPVPVAIASSAVRLPQRTASSTTCTAFS